MANKSVRGCKVVKEEQYAGRFSPAMVTAYKTWHWQLRETCRVDLISGFSIPSRTIAENPLGPLFQRQ